MSGLLGRTPAAAPAPAAPRRRSTPAPPARAAAARRPSRSSLRLVAFAALGGLRARPLGRAASRTRRRAHAARGSWSPPAARRDARPARPRAASAPGRARARRAHRPRGAGARPDGRRPARQAAAAGSLGQFADGLDRGLPGVQSIEWPYDGPGPVGPAHDPARRAGVPHGRGAARLLARPPRDARAARRGARDAPGSLRHRGRPARSRPARAPRARAAGARGRLAVAPAAAAPGGDRGAAPSWRPSACCRSPWPWPSTATAPGGTTTSWNWFGGGKVIIFDWNHTYGPLHWSREGDDAAERQVGPAALLEGRDARRVRRLPLDPRPRARRHPATAPRSPTPTPRTRGAGTTASTTWTGTSASA